MSDPEEVPVESKIEVEPKPVEREYRMLPPMQRHPNYTAYVHKMEIQLSAMEAKIRFAGLIINELLIPSAQLIGIIVLCLGAAVILFIMSLPHIRRALEDYKKGKFIQMSSLKNDGVAESPSGDDS